MFQTTSNLSINENKSQTLPPQYPQNNLPQIPHKPSSRREISEKKDSFKKKNIKLPLVKLKQMQEKNKPKTDRYNKKGSEEEIENIFESEVGEKLKMLIEDNNGETGQDVQSVDSSDFDFDRKVKKNKELIKNHREGKQKSIESMERKKSVDKKNNKIGLSEKVQKLFIKKSLQKPVPKRLSPKKSTDITKQREEIRGSIKSMKPRNQNQSIKKLSLPPKNSHKKKEPSMKEQKNSNLFDNLQTLLENPQDRRGKDEKVLVGLTLLKAKREAEDKMKAINKKLLVHGYKTEEKMSNWQRPERKTDEWRKVSFTNNKLLESPSNFDSELDHVSLLQQKCQSTLEDYIGFQQLLIELRYLKKLNKSPKKLNY